MLQSAFDHLSQEEIINAKRLKEIRESIHALHPTYTSKQKATLFAKEIYNIIEHALPNYSDESKKSVRSALLKRKLLSNDKTINEKDIFEISLELLPSDEVRTILPSWVESKIEIENVEEFIEHFHRLRDTTFNETAVTVNLDASEIINTSTLTRGLKEIEPLKQDKQQGNRKYVLVALLIIAIFVPIIKMMEKPVSETTDVPKIGAVKEEISTLEPKLPANDLPDYLQYKSINQENLRAWLHKRESKLAEEPYFSTILSVSQEFNIHPFLLFSITGQEQAFVPRTHERANEIVNNPFNVFHSWEDFNTNIEESSKIAARTIVNLSKDRPEKRDPIKWINRKYAEDPNWWVGVSSIFQTMNDEVK